MKESGTPALLRIDFPEKPKRGATNVERLETLKVRARSFGREIPKEMEAAAKKADKEAKVPEPKRAYEDRLLKWEERVGTAKALKEAGVSFALTTAGNKDPETFHKNLRVAIEQGLDVEVALAALTTEAAEILGVGDRLGTIEKREDRKRDSVGRGVWG